MEQILDKSQKFIVITTGFSKLNKGDPWNILVGFVCHYDFKPWLVHIRPKWHNFPSR